MTIFIRRVPHVAGGSVAYAPSAFEEVAAQIPDPHKHLIMPHGSYKETYGGAIQVRDRFDTSRFFRAPTAANSPTFETGAAKGYDVIDFVSASSQYMVPSDPAALALGTTEGYLYAVFRDTQTANNKYLIGHPTLIGASDYVPNVNFRLASGTEHLQILNGSAATARVIESAPTDLNTTAYHTALVTWNASSGFRYYLDGVQKTLTTTDLNGFSTSGQYWLGRRATAYADMKLACLLGGRLNLAHANYDTLRAQLLLVGQSQFIA